MHPLVSYSCTVYLCHVIHVIIVKDHYVNKLVSLKGATLNMSAVDASHTQLITKCRHQSACLSHKLTGEWIIASHSLLLFSPIRLLFSRQLDTHIASQSSGHSTNPLPHWLLSSCHALFPRSLLPFVCVLSVLSVNFIHQLHFTLHSHNINTRYGESILEIRWRSTAHLCK